MRKMNKIAWALLLPPMILLFFDSIFPTFYGIWLSFMNYYYVGMAPPTFIGLDNYRNLFSDPLFVISLGRGLGFAALCVAIEIPLGIALAIVITSRIKGRGILQTLIAIPLFVPAAVVGVIWYLMCLPGRGILPYLLKFVGFEYNLFRDPIQAFLTTVIVDVWHWVPFVAFILAAGIAAAPLEPFESAIVDGAGPYMRFRYILLPMLRPFLLIAILMRFIDSFKIFDEVFLLTAGGPGTSTMYSSIYLVRKVFHEWALGYGAAFSLFLLYLTLMLSWLIVLIITMLRR